MSDTDPGRTKTYKYVSKIRSCGGNEAWGDEDGDETLIAGKVPEVYMPKVVVERDGERSVIGVRYEREAMVELPKWMKADDAFAWVEDHYPEEMGGFLDEQ